ncbi:MAG: FUSC family protein, partial [Hymenobacteraceae bacterium]|nr:FUSC family protein [Hymenobacteraceae bacterium]MDX5511589.1 FUSC family protein [Hymenobacteraceae bacterium]
NKPYVLPQELQQAQQQLAAKTEAAGAGTAELKKVLQNINNLMQRLQDISRYFNAKQISKSELPKEPEFMRFVSHQEISFQTFRNNLSRSSSIFKHAVRVAVACLFGFVLTQILPYGEHSYWVLLTIIVILKPAFSLTKQRNIQRLSGTLAGAVIGVLILLLIPDKTIQFVLLVLFMLITFSFIRVNYIVSVLFMTPFILIIFNFLGAGGFDLVQERIIDTLLGSAIAFAASYVIFPSWEREQLQSLMRTAVDANLHYLQKVAERLQGQQVNEYDYKLARKEVYVSSANLSAAFQRMLSEPKSKQQNSSQVHRFVVLNHVLSANIATVASAVLRSDTKVFQPQLLQLTEQVLAVLQQTLQKLNNAPEPNQTPTQPEMMDTKLLNETEKQLAEQLSFICKVSSDLRATAV